MENDRDIEIRGLKNKEFEEAFHYWIISLPHI